MHRTHRKLNFTTSLRLTLIVSLVFGVLAMILAGVDLGAGVEAAAGDKGGKAGPQSKIGKPAPAADGEAQAALQRLGGSDRIVTQVSRQTGKFSFVRMQDGTPLVADSSAAASESRAFAFLSAHGALVGLNKAETARLGNARSARMAKLSGSELRVARVDKDSIGSTHVRLDQFYQGLPVFGGQLIVHMNDQGITAVNGNFVPEINFRAKPKLSAAAANAVALKEVNAGARAAAVKTELSIYRMGLLEGYQGQNLLAYSVEVTDGRATREQVWIDALKGKVLNRISLNPRALNRIIYTPEFGEPFDVRHEGDPFTPGPPPGTAGADPINNLYLFAGHTYNMFRSAFGRDSYDGLGHILHSVYLVNDVCPNAYWNGISTNYCPDLDADDVVAHEWGHAYTQFTHGLIYSYQSGALNESYSDIFGETADLLNGVDAEGGDNNAEPRPNGQRWQIGEDVNVLNQPVLGILRDMWTPTDFGQPDRSSSENYSCGSGDGGGVHANSGVPNHAFAMLVDGKTFNGQTVQGIGFTRALAIYYRAMTAYQTPTTDFAAHAVALQTACDDLIGETLNEISTSSQNSTASADTITLTICEQVDKAILATELNLPSPCPVSILLDPNTPAICDGATDVFVEDWETGEDGWTKTSTGTTPDWTTDDAVAPGNDLQRIRNFNVTSTPPAGGGSGSAIYGRNPPLGADGGGTCQPGGDYSGQYTIDSPTITIPANGSDLKLRFDHYVATEAGFDGSQVEISVNGGAFQLVPESDYIFNGPNRNLSSAVDANTNPNAGEPAWSGTNVGQPSGSPPGSWGTTIIDLASLTNPNDTIKVRFTFSQDGCNGVDGWYVDNIHVYLCPVLEAPVLNVPADYEDPDTNGSYTFTWTRPTGATGPDVLQETSTSCAPLLFDDAESGTGQWTAANDNIFAANWQTSNTKPQHAPNTAFWASPQEQGFDSATLTFNNPIQIPAGGTTKLNFSEWYFNEDDDKAFVEVSTDGGTNWTAIYTNERSMGDLPDVGADAFANEPLTKQQLDLTIYSGQTIRLRFRYFQGDSDFVFFVQYGWYIDDISIINDNWLTVANTSGTSALISGRPNGTRCYRVRTTYTFGSDLVPSPYSNIVPITVALSGAQLFSISGQVVDKDGNPMQGVTMSLSGSPVTTTDSGGNYTITNLSGGADYTLRPSKSGYVFNPHERTFTNLSSNQTGINFTGYIPTAVNPGDVLISEFRVHGAAGAADEFIELYNNTDQEITVGDLDGGAGWQLSARSGVQAIQNVATLVNGVVIPARGHYLIANATNPNGYSLGAYPGGNGGATATPDATYTADIPADAGLGLFKSADNLTADNRLDAAGFTTADVLFREGVGLTSPGANNGEYSFLRKMATTGLPRDTQDNAADFAFVATNAGNYGGVQSGLGAPGPENTASPIQRNATVKASIIDPQCAGASNDPNSSCARVRDTSDTGPNQTLGTLTFRRKFTNRTGSPVTRLRFRIVEITTLGNNTPSETDLRALNSGDITVTLVGGGTVPVSGTTVESPPTQSLGGGLNSSMSVTLAGQIVNNASVNIQLRVGVMRPGTFRFFVNVEALP